uniref:Uncharacterized protein n=1 Tax=uncultured organism MedDCM-OCT-S04-C2 TaxID=743613 RepID=D6PJ39_9ZZZZ|nr:hypothetical protein [uncultured organism MedDCM-OCT-S04-C2]
MNRKKTVHKAPSKAAVSEELGSGVDVQYNPDIIEGAIRDLETRMESKCMQIKKDADFMCTSIKQAFHLELIKLPSQVKQMSLTRFREEFGDSLEAVTRGKGASSSSSKAIENSRSSGNIRSSGSTSGMKKFGSRESGSVSSNNYSVFQTPSGTKTNGNNQHETSATPSVSTARKRFAREGEIILSANGSPLGEYEGTGTVIKPKNSNSNVPATPLQVPLSNGQVIDIEDTDIDSLSSDAKQDALAKMEAMMANMQALMEKLQK